MPPWWLTTVGPGSFIVFQRLNRFYKTFLILSGLTSALSAGVLQFQEFHPTLTPLQKIAEGFIVSSTAAAVISAMLGTMLLFRYEGYTSCTRKDLALAWSPLVMLDWSILAFLAGLVTWYKDKNPGWRADLVGITVGVGLVYTFFVSIDMYFAIKRPGGLGKADPECIVEGKEKESRVEESGIGNEEEVDSERVVPV